MSRRVERSRDGAVHGAERVAALRRLRRLRTTGGGAATTSTADEPFQVARGRYSRTAVPVSLTARSKSSVLPDWSCAVTRISEVSRPRKKSEGRNPMTWLQLWPAGRRLSPSGQVDSNCPGEKS